MLDPFSSSPLFRPTQYDLRFSLGGYPVRVHPLFWLAMAILGFRDRDLLFVATFVGCGFISILLHELAHGLMAARFRCQPRGIILHLAGGVCLFQPSRWLTLGRMNAITIAGPLTNLTLSLCAFLFGLMVQPRRDSWVGDLVLVMTWMNLIWGIVNLLPILPLDGSQIALRLLERYFPHLALRNSIILSIASLLIVACWVMLDDRLTGFRNWPNAFLLALIVGFHLLLLKAANSLGSIRFGEGFSSHDDDDPADWWKKS